MKIDYAKLFTLRKDGRYQGYWHELVDGKPVGERHTICDRDPKRLYDRIVAKETPVVDTLAAVSEDWWDKHASKLERSTQTTYRSILDKAIEEFGDMPISRITAADINAVLLIEKARGKSYKHGAAVLSIYNQVMNHAIATRKLTVNPAQALSVPRGMKRGHVEAPEKDIIETVKANLDKPFGEFVAVLLYTGMRKEEAAALVWGDIDDKFIHVHSAVDFHGTPKIKSTKTRAGERRIPILPPLKPYLVRPKKATNDTFVFNVDGKLLTVSQLRHRWVCWCKEAGLAEQTVYNCNRKDRKCQTHSSWSPKITALQLRHHFATVLFEAGFDELATQHIMGHESIETTRQIYTSLRKDYLEKQYRKLEEIF